jgi:hypothetical protein
MDWAFNDSFIEKFAEAFNLPLYFSWLQGGIEGEMLKMNAYSRPHMVETPGGIICLDRDISRTSPATRRRFPRLLSYRTTLNSTDVWLTRQAAFFSAPFTFKS